MSFFLFLFLPHFMGSYCFQGNYQIQSVLSRELVDGRSYYGKNHLQELRSRGYKCKTQENSRFQCDIVQTNQDPPGIIVEQIRKSIGSCAKFGPLDEEPRMVFRSEAYERYNYSQEIEFLGKKENGFSLFRLFNRKGQLDRIEANDASWALASKRDQLEWIIDLPNQEGRQQKIYSARLLLEPSK